MAVKMEIGEGIFLEGMIKDWAEMNKLARDWKTEYVGNVMDWNSPKQQIYAHFKDDNERHYLVEIQKTIWSYWKEKGRGQKLQEVKKGFNQIKYQNQFINEKYDRINLTVPKGEKAVIKERAEASGESVNEYIKKAIKRRMLEE